MNKDKPLGAVTLKSFQQTLEQDERIKATMINAEMERLCLISHK